MSMEIKLAPVAIFGTAAVGRGERFVLDLRGLSEPLSFINPKDMGTKYGKQYLKGDGQDILILNGVSKKQELMLERYLYYFEKETHKAAEFMNADEVKKLLCFLEENGFDDRYCSDLVHKESSYKPVRGRIFEKSGKPVRVARLVTGMTYADGQKTQEAADDSALFIVDNRGIGHITNVAEGYRSLREGETIISYQKALALFMELERKGMAK